MFLEEKNVTSASMSTIVVRVSVCKTKKEYCQPSSSVAFFVRCSYDKKRVNNRLWCYVHSNQLLIVQSVNGESVERKHVLPHSVAFVCTGLGTPTDDKM